MNEFETRIVQAMVDNSAVDCEEDYEFMMQVAQGFIDSEAVPDRETLSRFEGLMGDNAELAVMLAAMEKRRDAVRH